MATDASAPPLAQAAVRYLQPGLTEAAIASCHLNVLLTPGRLAYAYYKPGGEVVLLQTHTLDTQADVGQHPLSALLEDVLRRDAWLRCGYKTAHVYVQAQRWVCVPNEYISKGSELAYIGTAFSVDSLEDYPMRDWHRPLGSSILYTLHEDLHRQLYNYFRDLHLYHSLSGHLQVHHKLHTSPPQPKPTGLAEVHDRSLTYSVLRDGQLLFANSFPVTSASDVLYYVLSTHQVLGLREHDLSVMQTGEARLSTASEVLLREQFPHFLEADDLLPQQEALERNELFTSLYPYLLQPPLS